MKLGQKVRRAYHALAIDEHRKNFAPAIWDTSTRLPDQIVEQRWFCGAHSNVGGGYRDRVLSDISFLWMCDKVRDIVAFDEDYLSQKVERVEEAEARGDMVDTLIGTWKMMGRFDRVIGDDVSEAVDRSAFVRRHVGVLGVQPHPYKPYPYRSRTLEAYVQKMKQAGAPISNYFPAEESGGKDLPERREEA